MIKFWGMKKPPPSMLLNERVASASPVIVTVSG